MALYQSKRLFGSRAGIRDYGEVVRTERMKRREIREIPKDSDEMYYRFKVKEWKELEQPIMVREQGPRVQILTNLFLLLHSWEMPDLLIRSEEEYRLYMELRRLTGDELEETADGPLCCRWGSCLLNARENELRLIRDGKIVAVVEKDRFLRHPGRYFRVLREEAK